MSLVDTGPFRNLKSGLEHAEDTHTHADVSPFMNHRLSPFFFDPLNLRTEDIRGARLERGRYLYNEPDNKTFHGYLQSVVHDRESALRQIDTFWGSREILKGGKKILKGGKKILKEGKKEVSRDEDKLSSSTLTPFTLHETRVFSDRFSNTMVHISHQILLMTDLAKTWDYTFKDYHVVKVVRVESDDDKEKELYWTNMEICVYKPGCVYGKSISVSFFMGVKGITDKKNDKDIIILECNLSGIVPQEYIKRVTEIDRLDIGMDRLDIGMDRMQTMKPEKKSHPRHDDPNSVDFQSLMR